MSLLKLDEILTQVAVILYQAFPGQDWKEIHYVVRMSPDAKNAISDSSLVSNDESGVRRKALDPMDTYQVIQLLAEHRRVSEAMGQPWWFEFRMTVFSDARFKAEFGHRDSYQPEDLKL